MWFLAGWRREEWCVERAFSCAQVCVQIWSSTFLCPSEQHAMLISRFVIIANILDIGL